MTNKSVGLRVSSEPCDQVGTHGLLLGPVWGTWVGLILIRDLAFRNLYFETIAI